MTPMVLADMNMHSSSWGRTASIDLAVLKTREISIYIRDVKRAHRDFHPAAGVVPRGSPSVRVGGTRGKVYARKALDQGSGYEVGFSLHTYPAELADQFDQLRGFLSINRFGFVLNHQIITEAAVQ
jgi:hypothetical protein